MATNIEQLKEYARIIKDTPYALRTYLQTIDNTQGKGRNVPLDLFPDQIRKKVEISTFMLVCVI